MAVSMALDFDGWAELIDREVRGVLPACTTKSTGGDVHRWVCGERECQVHSVTGEYASLLVLRREESWPRVQRAPEALEIRPETCARAAREIIDWLHA